MRRVEVGALGLLLLLWGLAQLWEAVPAPPPLSPLYVDTAGHVLHVGLSADGKWRLPASPEAVAQVSPLLLAKEDRFFWYHPGIYPPALVRAAWQTLRGNLQGGSTLSMQLVRLWKPGPRTLSRKLQEILWALGLELRYTKTEILRLYLTYAPFGGNVEGIEAAAWRYFGKPATQLTPYEIAALLLVSQRPRFYKEFLAGERSFQQRALAWVERWQAEGLLSAAELSQARAAPSVPGLYPFPRLPLHVLPPKRPIPTPDTLFLSLPLQAAAQKRLKEHLAYWGTCGIAEGAILIADATTGAILAYVPSTDYTHCAIDLIQAQRALGSTLKPFLWAEAFERSMIHTESPLLDAPRNYGGYVPINFERDRYAGQVSASQALKQSLNAPAVDLLMRVGVTGFRERLRQLGFTGSLPSRPGLIVGAAEGSLWELVGAYTTLAEGRRVPLRRTTHTSAGSQGIWSEGTSWLVRKALRSPDGWSYKTGTSARLRDAWCVAWNSRYVVGVWLGNPNGSSSGCLKGAKVAFPLAQSLTALLDAAADGPPPPSVQRFWACPLTGRPVGLDCPTAVEAWSLRENNPPARCLHYQELWRDAIYTYCMYCLPDSAQRALLCIERLPRVPGITLHLTGQGDNLLPHNPSCPAAEVEILAPSEGAVLWLSLSGGALALEAVAAPPSPVLWGVGKDTLGWQPVGGRLWYRPLLCDTTLQLWAQVGQARRSVACKIQ